MQDFIYPSKDQYLKLQSEGRSIPFIHRIDTRTDLNSLCNTQRQKIESPFLFLDSARKHSNTGQYSFFLMQPKFNLYKAYYESRGQESNTLSFNSFDVYAKSFIESKSDLWSDIPIPFWGGIAGGINYEFKHTIEEYEHVGNDPYLLPDANLYFFHKGYVEDHNTSTIYAFYLFLNRETIIKSYEDCLLESSTLLQSIEGIDCDVSTDCKESTCVTSKVKPILNKEDFVQRVKKCKSYIRRGEIFQANLSHCLTAPFEGDLWTLYQRQREINPSSFMVFADYGSHQVACGSPERLFSVVNRKVSTRPIAGTHPRHKDPALDQELKDLLMMSEKERAEHIMLIDLERNDLGRVCEFGSVKVDECMTTEEYSHVRHIVSNISGYLSPKKDAWDVLMALFPGGTITGAPKIRAIEIIGELEGRTRGPYTGSIGYIGVNGNSDFNIVIRSLVKVQGNIYLQVGAGIVWDSIPEKEYDETLYKAEAFLQALREPKKPAIA